MYIITGIYAGSKAIEQPNINKLMDKSFDVLNQRLDELLNESKDKE